MGRQEFHFVDDKMIIKLDQLTREFVDKKHTPEEFVAKLKEMLPVHKTDQSTWKLRVEGYFEVSEKLFDEVLDKGQAIHGEEWNRQKVVVAAKMRPFSYYHWITGSREPVNNVLTRDDYLNDPTTALVKLEDDILALGKLFISL